MALDTLQSRDLHGSPCSSVIVVVLVEHAAFGHGHVSSMQSSLPVRCSLSSRALQAMPQPEASPPESCVSPLPSAAPVRGPINSVNGSQKKHMDLERQDEAAATSSHEMSAVCRVACTARDVPGHRLQCTG